MNTAVLKRFWRGQKKGSTVMAYNEAKETFQRATIADAKKCAPCQYGTAEGWLALADHELKYYWREMEDLQKSTRIVQDKSSEALKLTPCAKVAEPPKPAPPPPRRCIETG